jgi:phosphoribosylamine--glycine ligase
MLTEAGPKVLEFNCRFGDPETQAILPRIQGDLLETLAAAAEGDLGPDGLGVAEEAAVTVVLAARDYPEQADSGTPIQGLDEAEANALVFHAGTAIQGGRLVTNGGRVLDVTALGSTVEEARTAAYAACARISFDGMQYRRDIATRTADVAT